ncbi:MAG: hypothetical protein IIY30_10930, partial [Erysipelotrichaceae bacterium]|nr:hypothetical protein [Erysipelotrichaceae bacterium]
FDTDDEFAGFLDRCKLIIDLGFAAFRCRSRFFLLGTSCKQAGNKDQNKVDPMSRTIYKKALII